MLPKVLASLLVAMLIGVPLGMELAERPTAGADAPAVPLVADAPAAQVADAQEAKLATQAALDAVAFEENMGQADDQVRFIATTASGRVLLGKEGMTFLASGADGAVEVLELAFTEPLPTVRVSGEDRLGSVAHHYIGDASQWVQGASQFGKVRYEGLYRGIDLVVYGTPEGHIEFDHIIAPGADPRQARYTVTGPPRVDAGALVAGDFRLQAPVAYQETPKGRQHVDSSFHLEGHQVSYRLGTYDPTRPLVIDPVVTYSSYIGTAGQDYGNGIGVVPGATPATRDVYVGGYTLLTSVFPQGFSTTHLHGPGGGGMSPVVRSAFVAKFEYDLATGIATPQWVAYYGGGTSGEYGFGLAADANGVAIVGMTHSTNLPVQNAIEIPSLLYDGNVLHGFNDAFAARLDPNGALTFSTYLGGDGSESALGVGLGPGGHVLVTGQTKQPPRLAPDFPVVNAPQPVRIGQEPEAFAVKIDTTTSPASVVFSTFIGGEAEESGLAITEDATDVTVGGYVRESCPSGGRVACQPSHAFPTTSGAHQEDPAGGEAGFVTKIPGDGGPDWIFSTFLDGSGDDRIHDLDMDVAGNVWVTGITKSTDFPTAGSALSTAKSGISDAFLVQLSGDGSAVPYGSYIGGPGVEEGHGIEVLSSMVLLTGQTGSASGFPLMDAEQAIRIGSRDAFVLRLDTTTLALEFGTYLGGNHGADGKAIAGDDAGNIFVTGDTVSNALFPLDHAHQPVRGGVTDAFLTIYGKKPPLPVIEAAATGHVTETTLTASSYTVSTFETILLDGSGSVPGDLPIDLAATRWELKDGATVLATDAGTWAPVFSGFDPLQRTLPGTYEVCLTVEDTSGGPYAHTGTVCMDLEWRNRPPVGSIADCPAHKLALGREVVLTPTATDPEGEVLHFAWDWGDHNDSTGDPSRHTYAAKGTYEVELTVMDARGLTHESSCEVQVGDGPVAAFSYSGSMLMKEQVAFTDLSTAADQPLQTWAWDFGDGTVVHQGGVPAGFEHAFDEAGDHPVTLTVFDGQLSDSITHIVTVVKAEPKPVPDHYEAFLANDLEVPASRGLLSNDAHTGDWPMTVEHATQPQHGSVDVRPDGSFTYIPAAQYVGEDSFTYHVTDGTHSVGPVEVVVVVASGLPPNADFDHTIAGRTVVFEDRSQAGDTPIVQWRWRFSDGTEAEGRQPAQEFTPGHHHATLFVIDVVGAVSSVTKTFHIPGPASARGPAIPIPPPEEATAGGQTASADTDNRPPVAVASGPDAVRAGDEILLDGAGSHDPDGDDLSYLWRQVGGVPVDLADPWSSEATFVAPWRSGVLLFELEVSDGLAVDTAEVTMEVFVPQATPFNVQVLEDGTHWFNTTGASGTWAFGDGATATGSSVPHRFEQPGPYLVRLEVDGAESVQWIEVQAEQAPDRPLVQPAVEARPEPASIASVPDPRVPTAVTATAAGVGLLVLLVWAYRTWSLVWIRVFTRVGRPQLLEHPLRSQIHDAVQERPGLLLPDLVALLGKSRGSVLHHVGMLENAGMLQVKRAGGYISIHPDGSSGGAIPKEAALRSPLAQRLLKATRSSPGITVSDLAKSQGVTHQAISRQVARLESAGLVKKVREGRTTRVFLPDNKAWTKGP